MILYSLFSIILLWLTSRQQQEVLPTNRLAFPSVAVWCGVSAAILSGFLMVATSESLYMRPPETSAVLAAILVLLVVVLMSDKDGATFVRRPVFLLAILTFVVLYMSYSVYLVQPDLMHYPAFAGLDPVGDYANAVRILSLSRFEPGKVLFEPYYRTFPVVPIEIAAVALITGLPANIAYLIAGVVSEMLGVSCAVLLAWVAIGKRRDAQLSVAAFLAALVVLVDPQLIDPTFFILTPLGFSVFLLSLVLYLVLKSINSDRRWSLSAYVSIVLIAPVIAALHAASTAMMIILFTATVLSMKRRSIFRSLAIILMVSFVLYLVSSPSSPTGLFADIFAYFNLEYLAIMKAHQAGASVLNVLAAGNSKYQWSEVSSFLESVPQAFFLAIASVMIVRLIEDGNVGLKRKLTMPRAEVRSICENLGSFCLFCGLLFIIAFGGAYVLADLGGIIIRYIVFPLIPLTLLMTTVVLVLKSRKTGTGGRLLLLGLLTFYAISVATSPYFLMESSPIGARIIPTQSESAAASFLSDRLEINPANPTQIVADYPFQAEVQGVLLADHFYEGYVLIPDLISTPIQAYGYRTIVFARQYFIEDPHLRNWSSSQYEMPLTDSQRWAIFNRIFDDSSTCIYWGTIAWQNNTSNPP